MTSNKGPRCGGPGDGGDTKQLSCNYFSNEFITLYCIIYLQYLIETKHAPGGFFNIYCIQY